MATRIIDRNHERTNTSKAIGLQYRVSELLCWMGLFDRFAARAAPNGTMHLYVDGALRLRVRLDSLSNAAGASGFTPRPIVIPQCETEEILEKALRERGTVVERGTTFVRSVDTAEGVISEVVTATGSAEIASRYLVSCEGAHSVIRIQSGITFVGKTFPHDFITADVELDTPLDHSHSYTWVHPDGVLAAIAFRDERRWRLFIEGGSAADAPDDVTLERVRTLFVERTGDRETRVINPTWLTRFRVHSRTVDRFSTGRVFLAGDAAHLHSPLGGQGITTGMQDAYNLAWKLAAVLRGAPAALLATYGEERLPIARAVMRTTQNNTSLLFARTGLQKLVRDRIVFPLLQRPFVQRYMIAKISQLRQHYRRSSLSWNRRWSLRIGGMWAGDRAPDIVFDDAGLTATTSLFSLLHGGGFVALMTSRRNECAGLVRALERLGVSCRTIALDAAHSGDVDLIDRHGDFRRLYRARSGQFLLIRPDGYVALRCRLDRADIVRQYLTNVFSSDAVANAFSPRD